jgi:hypothetical protein
MTPKKCANTKPAVPTPAAPESKVLKVGRIPGNSRWSDGPIDYSGVSLDKKAAREIFGTDSVAAIIGMTNALLTGLGGLEDGAWLELAVNTIQAMKPRDATEAQLIAELVLIHGQMARMLAISRREDLSYDYIFKAVAAARELSKTYQQGMETLSRYRSGGKQQVVVSHVNVSPGAQAAIAVGGDVRAGHGEGGQGYDSKQSTP